MSEANDRDDYLWDRGGPVDPTVHALETALSAYAPDPAVSLPLASSESVVPVVEAPSRAPRAGARSLGIAVAVAAAVLAGVIVWGAGPPNESAPPPEEWAGPRPEPVALPPTPAPRAPDAPFSAGREPAGSASIESDPGTERAHPPTSVGEGEARDGAGGVARVVLDGPDGDRAGAALDEAMSRAEREALRCARAQSVTPGVRLRLELTVDGPTGRVEDVAVRGGPDPSAVAGCVDRSLVALRFPPASRETQVVIVSVVVPALESP